MQAHRNKEEEREKEEGFEFEKSNNGTSPNVKANSNLKHDQTKQYCKFETLTKEKKDQGQARDDKTSLTKTDGHYYTGDHENEIINKVSICIHSTIRIYDKIKTINNTDL